ncbi:MAG TPA: hypothetical protein VNM90_13960 [Haliangium sp.]|nr:hypothetical protein [Haliangium sp.]
MPNNPMWKLRRLAPRAKRVLERRKNEASVLAAYEPKLVPAADLFIAFYDHAADYKSTWQREMQEGRNAIAVLGNSVRSWVPLVLSDVVSLDTSDFADSPVADDVILGAQRLMARVGAYSDAAGSPLSYRESLAVDVRVKLEAAVKERSEAEAADRQFQQTLANARSSADAFEGVLQAFRKSLGLAVGRQDKDYQKLRLQRAAQRDEDDDPGAPVPELPDAPDESDDEAAA